MSASLVGSEMCIRDSSWLGRVSTPSQNTSGQVPDRSGQAPDRSGQSPDRSGQAPDSSGELLGQ
eukprot:8334577-Alexandrium_andersonii.AAC.1